VKQLCRFVLLLALAAPATRAELPLWRPTVQTDPMEFGSLRLETAFANVPSPGEWELSFTASQFNLWTHTWHTFALHREYDRIGEEIIPEQLRQIERNFPQDDVWHLDMEGWRSDLIVTRGLDNGMSLSLKVPYIEIGRPRWDGFGEGFHELVGIGSLEREIFPRGDTFIYMKDSGNEHIVERGRELNGGGIGDISIGLAIPLRDRWGGTQRVVVSAEAPTGDRDSLRGSGGVDANISWFGRWDFDKRRGTRTMTLLGGYTWLDPNGEWLGYERSQHLGHLSFGVDEPLWRNFFATFAVRIDSSPLWEVMPNHPGRPSLFYRLGLVADAGRAGWVGFDFGEELKPQTGVESDWSFHFMWGTQIR
jgi:hypothetical protein